MYYLIDCTANHTISTPQHHNRGFAPIQYLHFWPLKTASWAHDEVFGSKFVSFERVGVIMLIHRGLSQTAREMCNEQMRKRATFFWKCSPFTFQLWSFCIATVVHLPLKCSTFAMQRSLKRQAKRSSTPKKPRKTASEISRINFLFVTLFYCMYNICII